jgi:hypothetical protein
MLSSARNLNGRVFSSLLLGIFLLVHASSGKIALQKEHRISMIGAGMGSRMVHYGHFETEGSIALPPPSIGDS